MSDITNTRDAAADLAVCAAATPGPWTWEDGPATVYSGRTDGYHGLNLLGRLDPDWNGYNNLDFIAMARTALPHWIERATAAEEKLAHLADMITDYQAIGTDVERLQARLVEASEARYDWEGKAKAAEAEVERLRAILLDGQTPGACPVCFGNGEVLHLKPDGTLTGHGGCKACYGTGSKQEGGTA